MFVVFLDVSQSHSEFLSSTVSELISAEQKSGKQGYLKTEAKEEGHSQAKAPHQPTRNSIHPQQLPEQSANISVKAATETKPVTSDSSKGSSHAVSPKPRYKLLGLVKREKDKTAEVSSPQKERVRISQQKEPGSTQNLSQGVTDNTVDQPASIKQKAKSPEMTEVRTLQLTALQNTPFKETVTSEDASTQQEETEGRVVQLPKRQSSVKAFWEKENNSSKIICTGEEARYKDCSKMEIEAAHSPETNSDLESMNNNLSPHMKKTVENTTGRSEEKSLTTQTDCNLMDLSKEDGTYRANPVLICDEVDDSYTELVTELQICEPLENIKPSSSAFKPLKHEGDIPVPLPRQASSSPQKDKPAKTSELKHIWEKEYTGPRLIAAGVKEASNRPQSDLKTSEYSTEMPEGEVPTSPYKTKSNVVLKSLKVTDRSQLRSSGDVLSTGHRYQIKANTMAEERPLSPSKSQTPRSKDQDDEVRRSPSKTFHPRVLPRESSSPKRPRLEGSPLKTFPINIDPQTKLTEEHQGKPTPVPRQKKSPSHEAQQTVLTDTKLCTDIPSCPLPSHLEDRGFNSGNFSSSSSSTLPEDKKASEKKSGTFTRLVRSFVLEGYQHYLGPQEKAYVPSFHQEKIGAATESDPAHRPQNALRDFVGDHSDNPSEGKSVKTSSQILQNKDGNSSHNITTRAWSLSRASSSSELLISLSFYNSSKQ